MSKEIKKIYVKAGIKPPKGKGIHTLAFHKKAVSIMKSYKKGGLTDKEKAISYATAMKELGRERSLKGNQ